MRRWVIETKESDKPDSILIPVNAVPLDAGVITYAKTSKGVTFLHPRNAAYATPLDPEIREHFDRVWCRFMVPK